MKNSIWESIRVKKVGSGLWGGGENCENYRRRVGSCLRGRVRVVVRRCEGVGGVCVCTFDLARKIEVKIAGDKSATHSIKASERKKIVTPCPQNFLNIARRREGLRR